MRSFLQFVFIVMFEVCHGQVAVQKTTLPCKPIETKGLHRPVDITVQTHEKIRKTLDLGRVVIEQERERVQQAIAIDP